MVQGVSHLMSRFFSFDSRGWVDDDDVVYSAAVGGVFCISVVGVEAGGGLNKGVVLFELGLVSAVLRVVKRVAPIRGIVAGIPVSCKDEVLARVFVNDIVDVGVGGVTFFGVIAGHVDSNYVGVVIKGLVGEVAC